MTKITNQQPQLKWCVLANDFSNWTIEMANLAKENIIHEKHVSSQIVEVPNPNYLQNISLANVPKTVTTVLVSSVCLVEPKNKLEAVK